jgi:SPP1 family phage portal protein
LQVTDKLIEQCLNEFRRRQILYQVYKDYYKGQHDILKNYAMNKSRSNMKVVVNFFKKFINDEIAYSLGNPINYISTKGDSELIDAIDLNFAHWSKVHDQKLLKEANTYGESYEIQYITKDGEFKATVLNPLNCFVLESGDAEKRVELALHVYKENQFSEQEKMDVYVGNKILHYEVNSKGFTYVGAKEHIFPTPPVVVCSANSERISMLDDIKSLNDSYNNVLSDLVNEVSDFRQAFLKTIGATLDETEALKMKEKGIIDVPPGGDVGYLIKNINDTFVQNLLSTTEEKIYKLASHIDTNEKLQSNLSGTALRSRMIALENKCVLMQSMLEVAIKKRLKNFFYYIKIKTGKEYDYRTIKLKLTMNVPSDLVVLGDVISKLRDTVSQETLLSLLPFIENQQLEMEKFRKEQEHERLTLDNLGGSDES